ncbi:uncharacterized protein LOC141910983 [Tubulanus polymorphus]|uniref:uncharacterized protein LOC141910983 n=1 Tax=Tubulanus polymorphus TaxID=672921 RepID=UPI003DA59164
MKMADTKGVSLFILYAFAACSILEVPVVVFGCREDTFMMTSLEVMDFRIGSAASVEVTLWSKIKLNIVWYHSARDFSRERSIPDYVVVDAAEGSGHVKPTVKYLGKNRWQASLLFPQVSSIHINETSYLVVRARGCAAYESWIRIKHRKRSLHRIEFPSSWAVSPPIITVDDDRQPITIEGHFTVTAERHIYEEIGGKKSLVGPMQISLEKVDRKNLNLYSGEVVPSRTIIVSKNARWYSRDTYSVDTQIIIKPPDIKDDIYCHVLNFEHKSVSFSMSHCTGIAVKPKLGELTGFRVDTISTLTWSSDSYAERNLRRNDVIPIARGREDTLVVGVSGYPPPGVRVYRRKPTDTKWKIYRPAAKYDDGWQTTIAIPVLGMHGYSGVKFKIEAGYRPVQSRKSKIVTLLVINRITFKTKHTTEVELEGQNQITFVCDVEATPDTSVTFYHLPTDKPVAYLHKTPIFAEGATIKGWRRLRDASKTKIAIERPVARLIHATLALANPNKQDLGYFICVAENKYESLGRADRLLDPWWADLQTRYSFERK